MAARRDAFDPETGDYRALTSGEGAERSLRRAARFPPAGVSVAQSLGGEIWSRVTTRQRGRKVVTEKAAITGGLLGAGIALLALYEADKAVTGWLGSIGADLSAVNPLNWLQSGLNAAAAQQAGQSAAQAAAEAAASGPSSPRPSSVSTTCGCGLSNLLGGNYCGGACLGFMPTL